MYMRLIIEKYQFQTKRPDILLIKIHLISWSYTISQACFQSFEIISVSFAAAVCKLDALFFYPV